MIAAGRSLAAHEALRVGLWGHRSIARAVAKYDPPSRAGHDIAGAIDKITCSALVMRGGESDVLHDEDAEKLAQRFANGRWVRIEGAGHTVQGDRPRAFVAEFTRFLDETLPPESRG